MLAVITDQAMEHTVTLLTDSSCPSDTEEHSCVLTQKSYEHLASGHRRDAG